MIKNIEDYLVEKALKAFREQNRFSHEAIGKDNYASIETGRIKGLNGQEKRMVYNHFKKLGFKKKDGKLSIGISKTGIEESIRDFNNPDFPLDEHLQVKRGAVTRAAFLLSAKLLWLAKAVSDDDVKDYENRQIKILDEIDVAEAKFMEGMEDLVKKIQEELKQKPPKETGAEKWTDKAPDPQLKKQRARGNSGYLTKLERLRRGKEETDSLFILAMDLRLPEETIRKIEILEDDKQVELPGIKTEPGLVLSEKKGLLDRKEIYAGAVHAARVYRQKEAEWLESVIGDVLLKGEEVKVGSAVDKFTGYKRTIENVGGEEKKKDEGIEVERETSFFSREYLNTLKNKRARIRGMKIEGRD